MIEYLKNAVKHAVIRRMLREDANLHKKGGSAPGRLSPSNWLCAVNQKSELQIDGVGVNDIAKLGTPIHVISDKKLRQTYHDFLNSFKAVYPNTVLATSYKTNPVPHVLDVLRQEGARAEVISHFELWLALKLQVEPQKIILNGPGKGDAALDLGVQEGIGLINIDGPAEIAKIARFARKYNRKQRVGLRVTTSVGWTSQFGLSIGSGAALSAFSDIRKHADLDPVGLHLHLGTGIQSIETYVQAVTELLEFRRRLQDDLDIRIDHLDLGGGFGVPTVRALTEWDLRMISLGYPARTAIPNSNPDPSDYASALAPVLGTLESLDGSNGGKPLVVLEPGRAITSSAQTLILSVIGIKPGVDGKEYLILDGGKNITMPLGWETHQLYLASDMRSTNNVKYDLFGPLCHPGDIIAKNISLPRVNEGDLIAVMDAGAYFIPNQMNFSNPRPPIVAISDAVVNSVRDAESFDDVIRLDNIDR